MIEFAYFPTEEADSEYLQKAKPYRNVMDFAFFAVNFGYSKEDYQRLTPTEKAFILKAYEDKVVSMTTLINMAVTNAVSNILRKKGKPPQKLWTKKSRKIVDKDIMKHTVEKIAENEKIQGKSWVEKIYKANNMKFRQNKR